MRFFLVLFILLISYGSLYPFDIDFKAHSGSSLFETLWKGSHDHTSISDIFGNIALFLPYGAIIAVKNRSESAAKTFILFISGLVLATILQVLKRP